MTSRPSPITMQKISSFCQTVNWLSTWTAMNIMVALGKTKTVGV